MTPRSHVIVAEFLWRWLTARPARIRCVGELRQVPAVPGLRSGSVVADTRTNGRRKHSPACVQEMTRAGAGRLRPRRALYAMPQRCGDRRSSVLSGCPLPPTARSNVYRSPGQSIALFNVDGTFYAINDTCSHRGGPLGEGELHGAIVTCPWHGATFDVQTGAVTGPPARASVRSFRVRVDGNDVLVEMD